MQNSDNNLINYCKIFYKDLVNCNTLSFKFNNSYHIIKLPLTIHPTTSSNNNEDIILQFDKSRIIRNFLPIANNSAPIPLDKMLIKLDLVYVRADVSGYTSLVRKFSKKGFISFSVFVAQNVVFFKYIVPKIFNKYSLTENVVLLHSITDDIVALGNQKIILKIMSILQRIYHLKFQGIINYGLSQINTQKTPKELAYEALSNLNAKEYK
ncbi:hypothetical protein NOVO_08465 [Rickettsiales bacterium Ac37b]|nr:hypothetical protein NOVO_08465 [Rickettsiales bacterium Ac37b]